MKSVKATNISFGLSHFADQDPDAITVVDPEGATRSRGALVCQVNRLSRALRAVGILPGDGVAVISRNCAEYLVTYFAAMKIGAYFAPINWHLRLEEVTHLLRQSRARIVFTDKYCCAVTRSAIERVGTGIAAQIAWYPESGFLALQEFIANFDGGPVEVPVTGRVLTFTSATTGVPKCVVRPLESAEEARDRHIRLMLTLNQRAGIEIGAGTHLCQSMLYHTVPLSHSVSALNLGHRVVLMNSWSAEQALILIEKYGVQSTFMVPSMFAVLVKLPEHTRRRYKSGSLRLVTHGGASTPIETKRQMIEWWGDVVHELYGASEGIATGVTAAEWRRYPGTVGRPHPGIDIKIMDASGESVPAGHEGLIYIRSLPGERFEYLNDRERTLDAYRGDYFTAGDVGYVNADGYLFICDRLVDMVIRGGINVYPAEIERTLVLHPAVVDCAVFGIPDVTYGESIVAMVQIADVVTGDGRLSADILKFLIERLSPEKVPTRLVYTAESLRDPAGKMHKRRIKEIFNEKSVLPRG
jgi:long-chain acyl-CoA synthetase